MRYGWGSNGPDDDELILGEADIHDVEGVAEEMPEFAGLIRAVYPDAAAVHDWYATL